APAKVVEWRSYTAWGEPTVRDVVGNIVNASPTVMPYGYHGAPHDLATRLVDMRFRVYRPSWGRFVSPDPLGLVDGSNRFAFVGGSVLSYRDPWGLKCEDAGSDCGRGGERPGVFSAGYEGPTVGTYVGYLLVGMVPPTLRRASSWTTEGPAVAEMRSACNRGLAVLCMQARARQNADRAMVAQEHLSFWMDVGLSVSGEAVSAGLAVGANRAATAGLRAAARPVLVPTPDVSTARPIRELSTGEMGLAHGHGPGGGPLLPPDHHLMTNKNRTSTARGGPWTPRFEDMAQRAGMTLDDAENRVRIPGHRGPHPQAYHEAIFERLRTATSGLQGAAFSSAFRAELAAIRAEAATAGSALNRLLVP
ncbi:MAG: AHH domain-containing protein, partial [Kofleriaceae bacterium]|nr:AHH domain-containing protein [Kofleriaceae bacterium]